MKGCMYARAAFALVLVFTMGGCAATEVPAANGIAVQSTAEANAVESEQFISHATPAVDSVEETAAAVPRQAASPADDVLTAVPQEENAASATDQSPEKDQATAQTFEQGYASAPVQYYESEAASEPEMVYTPVYMVIEEADPAPVPEPEPEPEYVPQYEEVKYYLVSDGAIFYTGDEVDRYLENKAIYEGITTLSYSYITEYVLIN